tara:strand:+ start:412 stop:594 length:183 start_codon:yes stop_codon:yes gene_type:complete
MHLMTLTKIVVNSRTFEEAGCVSENPFNFVAQNIYFAIHGLLDYFRSIIVSNNKNKYKKL